MTACPCPCMHCGSPYAVVMFDPHTPLLVGCGACTHYIQVEIIYFNNKRKKLLPFSLTHEDL